MGCKMLKIFPKMGLLVFIPSLLISCTDLNGRPNPGESEVTLVSERGACEEPFVTNAVASEKMCDTSENCDAVCCSADAEVSDSGVWLRICSGGFCLESDNEPCPDWVRERVRVSEFDN